MSLRVLQLSLASPDPDALGGVAVHVAALAANAPDGVVIRTAHPSGAALEIEGGTPGRLEAVLPLGQRGSRSEDPLESALVAALLGTRTDVLHVHSPLVGPRAIAQAALRAHVPLVVSLHDHALACANYELLEGGTRFCGVPEDLSRCDRCLLRTHGRPAGSQREFRASMGSLVAAASAVVAPSGSVLALVARAHPSLLGKATRIPWGVPAPRAECTRPATAPGPLRVAVVGVWARVKGTERLPELLAACKDLDVEWHLFGATEGASREAVRRSGARVVLHGAYRRAALAPRLERAGCQLALLPSIGAESFSLALSEVTAAGLPVIASELGALGERVREEALGWTFDPWAPGSLRSLVGTLVDARARIDAVARHVRARPHRSEADMARAHAALWADVVRRYRDAVPSPREPGFASRLVDDPVGAYRAGELAARARRPARVARLLARLRRSDFYRDLSLRRLLSEETRRTVEERMTKLLGGGR